MSIRDISCAKFIPVILAIGFIANLAMLIQVFRKWKTSGKGFFLYGCLSMCNLLSTLALLITPIAMRVDEGKINLSTILSASIVRFSTVCLNCGFNLAIAYSRMCVVTQPFKYSNPTALWRLSRRTALTVVVVTIVSVVPVALGTAISKMLTINIWALTIVLIITSILLCSFYWKLLRAYRKRNKEMIRVLDVRVNKNIIENRERQERYLRRLFIGITTSFFVLNLPVMIVTKVSSIYEVSLCDSTEGKLKLFAYTCVIINMVFDPLWFSYILWRMKRDRQSHISPTKEVAVPSGNSRNERAIALPQNKVAVLPENNINNLVFDPFWPFHTMRRMAKDEQSHVSHQNEIKVLPGNSRNEIAVVLPKNEVAVLQGNSMNNIAIVRDEIKYEETTL